MTVIPKTSAGRIALAIGLSILAHAILLFAPLIELPPTEAPLPQLSARLEPLPKLPATKLPKKPQSKPAEPTTPPIPKNSAAPDAHSPATPDEEPQAVPEPPLAEEPPAPSAEPHPAHPLPRQARLTFNAYQGSDGMQIGKAIHRLDITDGRYILMAVTQTTGLASVFKSYLQSQTSQGSADAQGLRPQYFKDEKKLSDAIQNLNAAFDWGEHKLRFSHGGETALPEQAQDILSFLYQLSQLSFEREFLPIYISNGKKLEYYELEIGAEEEIASPLGKLRALHLSKRHGPGEEGLEIWLGLEYRLLPVKIRQLDRNGQVAGEMVIADIRVADE